MAGGHYFTFGHSTRSADETVDLLRGFGVTRVVDVRTIRGSRHNPQFGADAIAAFLTRADIDYRWVEAVGGRRRAQQVDPAVNAGWTHPSFHHYADYALSPEFEAGVAELTRLADRPAALMCAEAVPWRCHRSVIATVLVARGWTVTHILAPGHSQEHELGRWGALPVIGEDGHITYPAGATAIGPLGTGSGGADDHRRSAEGRPR